MSEFLRRWCTFDTLLGSRCNVGKFSADVSMPISPTDDRIIGASCGKKKDCSQIVKENERSLTPFCLPLGFYGTRTADLISAPPLHIYICSNHRFSLSELYISYACSSSYSASTMAISFLTPSLNMHTTAVHAYKQVRRQEKQDQSKGKRTSDCRQPCVNSAIFSEKYSTLRSFCPKENNPFLSVTIFKLWKRSA